MSETQKRQKQILVVGDECILAADLQDRLEGMGFSVPAVAGSGHQAVLLSRYMPFDLVVMDMRLEGHMNGIQAAQALRREHNVPIVYVTGYADIKAIEQAKATGASAFVVKPIRDASLRAAVEISLKKHKVEQDAADRPRCAAKKCDGLRRVLRAASDVRARKRARELHVDIQKQIAAIALELEIQQYGPGVPPHAVEVIRDASRQLRQLSRAMSGLSEDMYPQIVEGLGLAPATDRLCRQCGSQGLSVDFRHRKVPAVVPAAVSLCLYRVTQEALRNVVKHAATAKAAVSLEGTAGGIGVCITDRGSGFDPEIERAKQAAGLAYMAQRVESLGGTFHLTSAPGFGTRICATLPIG